MINAGPFSEQDIKLFRTIILLVLLLIFIATATSKIWELRVAAERTGVTHTLAALRGALGIHLSKSVIRDGLQSLASLHHSNPIKLLQQPEGEMPYSLPSGIVPQNYLGEFHSDEAPEGEGVWYFDLDLGVLVYRVNFDDYFYSSNTLAPNLARYQLRVRFDDLNRNGRFDPAFEKVMNIALEALDHYSWLNEPHQPPIMVSHR
ncbi:MAG: hypothetical protein OEZ16_02670 [Chromatiales bacterium]|nr:hypothetical protein [Chromatiales bacterium]